MTACAIVLSTQLAIGDDSPAEPESPQPENQPATESMTRGPLHVALAEVHVEDPLPGLMVDKQPPEPMEETRPPHGPEGEDLEWIPGYWGWDEDREDFVWISGLWRRRPPGREWVPGYWNATDGGWQWVSGYWGLAENEAPDNLPTPPKSPEAGPAAEAPNDDSFYVPGHWARQQDDYLWKAGFWAPIQKSWVWVPNGYLWTPRGCVFRPGYWDYLPHKRGVLYAPIGFRDPLRIPPGYRVVPSCVIDLGPSFFVHLFIRPSYCHYYFGDYYAARYRSRSIIAWPTLGSISHRYDPLYAHFSCGSYRHSFLPRVHGWHSYFGQHHDVRPARTLAEQALRRGKHDEYVRAMTTLGRPCYDYFRERLDLSRTLPYGTAYGFGSESRVRHGFRRPLSAHSDALDSRRTDQIRRAVEHQLRLRSVSPSLTHRDPMQEFYRRQYEEVTRGARRTVGAPRVPHFSGNRSVHPGATSSRRAASSDPTGALGAASRPGRVATPSASRSAGASSRMSASPSAGRGSSALSGRSASARGAIGGRP
jgi:hypothetical protein